MPIKSTIFCPTFDVANKVYSEAVSNKVTKLKLSPITESKMIPYDWVVSFECDTPGLANDILEKIQDNYSSVKTEIES